jgi:E3 ubiquitin-protein ligase HECTD3
VLSDGKSQTELVPGGENKDLTFENRVEYARKLLYVRMNEFRKQADAVKKGIT